MTNLDEAMKHYTVGQLVTLRTSHHTAAKVVTEEFEVERAGEYMSLRLMHPIGGWWSLGAAEAWARDTRNTQ